MNYLEGAALMNHLVVSIALIAMTFQDELIWTIFLGIFIIIHLFLSNKAFKLSLKHRRIEREIESLKYSLDNFPKKKGGKHGTKTTKEPTGDS